MAFDKSKFIGRFVDEAREHIKKLNDGLLHLEKEPGDTENMDAIFRAAHTIKGSSKMLQLQGIPEVAHTLEDALDALRKKNLEHSKELSDLFFKGVDIIADMIEQTASGEEITMNVESICGELESAAKGELKAKEQPKPEIPDLKEGKNVSTDKKDKEIPTDSKDKDVSPKAKKTSQKTKAADKKIESKKETGPPKAPSPEIKKAPLKSPGSVVEETIRIDSAKLDETIKLMEEMVSNHSRVKHRLNDLREAEILSKKNLDFINHIIENKGFSTENGHKDEIIQTANSLHLKLRQLLTMNRDDVNLQDLLTGELQEKALRMRMLPLSTVFDTFHRPVRDISRSFGKKISLVIEGGETELDKKMIEELGAPLMHMIRNSIDHGIEIPEEREKTGKPEIATIHLSASYEGGNVLIELSDDGGGIPIKMIKEKALQRRLVEEDNLKNMSESEIVDLIFHPGFSTSAIITDISGRGVGMDVVKKNIIDQLNGSIKIKTNEGEGTSFFIRLPLTLAIMRVVQFVVADMVFAVSENSVSEILKLPKSELIDVVDKKAIRLREQIIPVVNMQDLLNIPGKKSDKKDLLILMVFMGSEQLGLAVDAILDEEDMVIKPLPSHMKRIQWVSGVTISGENEVVSVLHVPMLISASKEMKSERRYEESGKEEKKSINILLVEDSISTREIERSVLESYGYKVDVAADGVEGLEKAKEFTYDAVITDIEMPRMDGFTLTEKLRKESEYEHTPIIIVTSLDKEEDKKRGVRVGADAYIVKGSFDQSNLIETVQNLVGS